MFPQYPTRQNSGINFQVFDKGDYYPCESPIELALYKAMPKWMVCNIITQYKIPPYRLDFYMPSYFLDIEADGKEFHLSRFVEDRQRDRELLSLGIMTVRFAGSEIYTAPKLCVDYLIKLCRKRWYYPILYKITSKGIL